MNLPTDNECYQLKQMLKQLQVNTAYDNLVIHK